MIRLVPPILLSILLPLTLSGQTWISEYFDSPWYYNGGEVIPLTYEGDTLWQVGPPQKTLFDQAATQPNAIMTDTLAPYPINQVARFGYTVAGTINTVQVLAIQWMQKVDTDFGSDGCIVEFSLDNGITWENPFYNPVVYNFFGFDYQYTDTLPNGQIGFTGTDTTWRNVWLCLLTQNSDILMRHTFVSDSIDQSQSQEGWMIDNLLIQPTFSHTVGENTRGNFFKIHPNPSPGRVYIENQDLIGPNYIEKMELVDLEGRVVQQWGKRPPDTYVDLEAHPNGVYFLNIQTQKNFESFKVILAR